MYGLCWVNCKNFEFSFWKVGFYFSGAAYPAIASSAVEPLIAGLACLAAAHLSVLKDNLQYMHRYSEEECPLKNVEVNWHKNRAIFQEIQKCIKHHYVVLK